MVTVSQIIRITWGTRKRCRFGDPSPDLLSKKPEGGILGQCVFNKNPRYAEVESQVVDLICLFLTITVLLR